MKTLSILLTTIILIFSSISHSQPQPTMVQFADTELYDTTEIDEPIGYKIIDSLQVLVNETLIINIIFIELNYKYYTIPVMDRTFQRYTPGESLP